MYLSFIGTDITDDYVDPTLQITSPQIISIKVGQKFKFTARYFVTSGTPVDNPNLVWIVSPSNALTIDDIGFATATSDGVRTIQVSIVNALGTTISAETSFSVREVVTVITETAKMTTNTGTSTKTVRDLTTNTSTTTVDDGVVVTAT